MKIIGIDQMGYSEQCWPIRGSPELLFRVSKTEFTTSHTCFWTACTPSLCFQSPMIKTCQLAMTLLHPSSCPSNTISLQVHPIFFAWGHLSSQLRPALLEDFITFLYQLGQVQIRDRSSGYLNSPPHQKQSSEGAWHDQKAIRPLYRIKEELNVRFQDGLGTGQCHSLSPVGSHGTHMVTGALTSVQCCSRRGAVHVDWTLTPSPSEGSDMW